MASEEWRPVSGFEGLYEVSDFGNVRSLRIKSKIRVPAKIMSPSVSWEGYRSVKMGGRTWLVHRLVLEAFLGPAPAGFQSAHQDGDPSNNRLDNLKWMTPLENTRQKSDHGTVLKGERNGFSRFTEADVREMRRLYASGMLQRVIAEKFGTVQRVVSLIVRRERWKHVA